MTQLKRQVVMLPTQKATWPNCIWLGRISGQLRLDQSYNHKKGYSQPPTDDSMLPQHLYFLSDESIQVGDWVYQNEIGVRKVIKIDTMYIDCEGVTFTKMQDNPPKKIIVTTDKSLVSFDGPKGEGVYYLPEPSKEFIEVYIREYNKNSQIHEVMVEYNEGCCKCDTFEKLFSCPYRCGDDCNAPNPNNDFYGLRPKVKKDNTVSISSIKTSWTREEVKTLCINAFMRKDVGKGLPFDYTDNSVNNWIQNNL